MPVKVLLVGECQAGKTSIAARYVNGKVPGQYTGTLGVDYLDRHVDVKDTNVHINIWDFSGRTDFLDIRNEFYKEGSIVLLVLDLTTKKAVDTCDLWLKEIKDNGGSCPIMLVGSKSDSKKIEQDLTKFARERGCTYFEVSARDNPTSVDQLFLEVMSIVL